MADRPRRRTSVHEIRRWLTPGIGVKRWLVVVFLGELGLAFGLAFVLRQVYRDVELGEPIQTIVSTVTLQSLPYGLRALILASVGVAVFAFASWKVDPGPDGPVPVRRRGPAARRGHLPEAVPRPRPAGRRARRRDRAVDAAARPQGAHEQPHRGRDRGRRRRLVRASSGPSSGCRRSATSGTASSRWPTPSRSWASCSSTASRGEEESREASAVTPSATS